MASRKRPSFARTKNSLMIGVGPSAMRQKQFSDLRVAPVSGQKQRRLASPKWAQPLGPRSRNLLASTRAITMTAPITTYGWSVSQSAWKTQSA